MTMTKQEAIATWRAEANEKIVVVPPQGVGGTGDVRVTVEGHEVARYSSWAALVTKESALREAEEYAELLRQRYINLATGDPGFGKRRI